MSICDHHRGRPCTALVYVDDATSCHERYNSDPHPTPEIRSRG